MSNVQDSSAGEIDDNTPLWKYVKKLDKVGGGGGNVQFQCSYCQLIFKGTYYRVKAHLLKLAGHGIQACKKVTRDHLVEMQKIVDEAEVRIKKNKPKQVPLPPSTNSSKVGSSSSASTSRRIGATVHEAFEPRKRKGNSAIEKAFNLGAREELHSEIARMFFSAGLPFHLARNPHYVRSYTFAANNNISGYVPPGYNLLRTTLLQRERANIENLVVPIKESWKESGVTIVSDGWTDPRRRPIINFMAMSISGPMFLKAINCQGEYKDKFFISNLIKETIQEVGSENVIQVITDNAPVCRSAGLLVEAQFPKIFWTPCVVHTLNLALKNICAAKNTEANEVVYQECHWITMIADDCMVIKNFIMNHSMRLAMFNEHVKLMMLSIAETRFASTIVMLKRFKQIKRGLQDLVVGDRWASYREDNVGKAAFVRGKILSEIWWDDIDYILAFTEPIYDMLRRADMDAPCLHLVYDMWDSMIDKVKAIIYLHDKKQEYEECTFFSVVHQILSDRWSKSNTPLHCLAHSLNPRFYSSQWLQESPKRVPPHRDEEISSLREKCFQRYFTNAEERRKAKEEYAYFSAGYREFASANSLKDRALMEPAIWWISYGSSIPIIQSLALKILGHPCSSSCCERNWSTYSFIHSLKRNKITPQRAEDLVFVHSNLRFLSRKIPQYNEGDTKMWDVGGDAFDSLEGSGILEIANLSLDEPDLEAVLFTDDGDGDDFEVLEDPNQ